VNHKQRVALAAAIFFCVLAIFLANEAPALWALPAFVAGLICAAGVWSFGLAPRIDSDDAEWQQTIREN
jgi:hypothetical protein